MTARLEADRIRFSYGDRLILDGISLAVETGSVTCIVGPNGAGKTTFVNVLTGLLTPAGGEVRLEGRPIGSWSRREIARRIALIPPDVSAPFEYTVTEVVEMGRYPHADAFQPLGDNDRAIVSAALARTGLDGFQSRIYSRLSSGERQRAVIARALAQEPRFFIMDEPTVHLDVHYQVEFHELMRSLARDGLAVLAISHDLNLAAHYSDRLVLLDRGRIVRAGRADEVLDARLLSEVYRTPLEVFPHPRTGRPAVWPAEPAAPTTGPPMDSGPPIG